MHRTVDPHNLCVTFSEGVRGVVTGFESMMDEIASDLLTWDPLPDFYAPEIVDLAQWESTSDSRPRPPKPPAYTRAVDVWGLGLSMYALHAKTCFSWLPIAEQLGERRPEDHVTRARLSRLHEQIEGRLASASEEESDLLEAISRMLQTREKRVDLTSLEERPTFVEEAGTTMLSIRTRSLH